MLNSGILTRIKQQIEDDKTYAVIIKINSFDKCYHDTIKRSLRKNDDREFHIRSSYNSYF